VSGPYKVHVEITSIKGRCPLGHKVGHAWLVEGGKTPSGVCAAAWNAVFPYVRVLSAGGDLDWAKDKDVMSFACPDAENAAVFELRRLRD